MARVTSQPMRICVVSQRDATRDPHVEALVASLLSAGNEVVVVCGAPPRGDLPGAEVVDASPPRGWLDRGRRRLTGTTLAEERRTLLRGAVVAAVPEIVYPSRIDDVELVRGLGIPIARHPSWPAPPDDLIALAPHDTRLSSSPARPPAPYHQPTDEEVRAAPAPGRHEGLRIAVAARFTATNPSRYLVAALERAGVDVVRSDGAIDGAAIAEVAGLVIVESPLPALVTTGPAPKVPTLFWVHHGEHHLSANLRLTRRYAADAVLLAHSWHLAHRFPVPVHRFPFAVARELLPAPTPFAARSHDVAMVGAGLNDPAVRYDRRQRLATQLQAALGSRAAFRSGITPEDVVRLYGDARIVVNEGGDRHFPITMWVFEALGAGALLVTDDLPGTDVVLRKGDHYVVLDDDDPMGQIETLATDERSAGIAAAGHTHAMDRHTYDHRVDELVVILNDTVKAEPPQDLGMDALSAAIDQDVEVHSVAVFGADVTLPDRVVRRESDAVARLAPGRTDAVVIGRADVHDLDRALAAARRYVYAVDGGIQPVRERITSIHPQALVTHAGSVLRADLGALGYRVPAGSGSAARGQR